MFTGAPEVVASLTSLPCLSNVQKGHALHWQRGQCAFALSAMQNFAHDAVFRSPGKVDEHGWPSFRDAEVDWTHVRVLPNGECISDAGTHLGHNLPDGQGNRYCINCF